MMVGVRPVPDALGRVNKLEVIPLEELGRPRIDVVVNCSGVFRDLFVNQMLLLDRGIKAAAELVGGAAGLWAALTDSPRLLGGLGCGCGCVCVGGCVWGGMGGLRSSELVLWWCILLLLLPERLRRSPPRLPRRRTSPTR